MFGKKQEQKHRYEFNFEIMSDDKPIGAAYHLTYRKIVDDLPYTPFIGLSISDTYRPLKITNIFLNLKEDRTFITLEDTVGSIEQIEKYIEKAEPYLIESGWKPWLESRRPDKS